MGTRTPSFKYENNNIVVENRYGRLTLALPPQPSFFFCKSTKRLFGFVAGGDCTVSGKIDNISETGKWMVETLENDDILLKREEISTIWQKKTFILRVTKNAFCWYHQLDGEGELEDVRFFRSCFQGREYGFAGNFDEVYSAAPNFREQQYFHPCARVVISNGNDSSANTGLHALASVPHVMGLHDRRDKTQLGVAVFASPGEYLWDEMVWNPEVLMSPSDYDGDLARAGGFAIRYYGKKHICGTWTSPCLIFTFPGKVDDTLATALKYAYSCKFLPRPGKHKRESWWSEPIYCMWDDQTALAFKSEIDYHQLPDACPGDFATEYWAERWLGKLAENNITPGIIILDDKWQKSKLSADPDLQKWSDLRGWIERCHQRGIKVFLWGMAWHNEDIPLDEAITCDGKVVAGDVTNPKYEKRLREKVYRYFSADPGCLNADGVKIDGLMALPVGRNLKNYGNIWGLELQKRFLQIVYSEAKKAKADVCISTFAANPYLDEFTDMLRLADMFTYRLTTEDSMHWRHSVYKATNPHVLIDTDSQMNYNLDPDYLHALEAGAQIGIPTVYNAEYLRRNRYFFAADYRKLTEKEYKKIAEIFAGYRKKSNKFKNKKEKTK
ncbi:MAG: hypothetical protein E7043_09000 [Lentisphaerae bacterium]|nr:hypothetical protein [Lentisphaerota bacterium]